MTFTFRLRLAGCRLGSTFCRLLVEAAEAVQNIQGMPSRDNILPDRVSCPATRAAATSGATGGLDNGYKLICAAEVAGNPIVDT
jgi:hypothetical protein